MKTFFKTTFLCFVFLSETSMAQGGGKSLNITECILKARTSFAPERLQSPVFVPGTGVLSYISKDQIIEISASDLKEKTLCSLIQINAALRKSHADTLTSIPVFERTAAKEVVFYYKNKKYSYQPADGTLKTSSADELPNEEHLDIFEKGKKYAFVKNHQLYVFFNDSVRALTTDGSEEQVYGQSVHQNEFGITKGTFWSPRGNYLAFYRMDQSKVFKYPIIDWSGYPATSRTLIYPMNGTTSHTVQVGIYSFKSGKIIYLQTDPDEHYLTNLCWTPDEKYILLAELNRDQNHMKMNVYDAATGNKIKTLFEEQDEKYVEPLNSPFFLDEGNTFVWQSRRSGYNHLYLYDMSGKLLKTLTSGSFEIKQVSGYDKKNKFVYYISNEGNPIGQDVYRISLKNGRKERLTNGRGTHIPFFNEAFSAMLDTWTATDVPRVAEFVNLKSLNKKIILNSENPLKEYRIAKWKVFYLKTPDGDSIYARIFYPPGLDSARKYPVLVYLYNGPHSQLVTDSWMGGGEVWYHYMAQNGFIVFTLDGRGTSFRGKAFEQKIYRQLGKIEMNDQLLGVRWLKSKPFVDSTRMGVFGWSFGGFMTLSLMTRHPGVFKAAVAGGPVVDWRYYEIMYGERYMDTYETNKEGFEENSLLNHIQNLKGKLLVIHGAIDPVVVWQHSMLLLKKAIEKGVHFDYYVYPHHEHNVLGKDRAHLMEKVTKYFIDNL